MAAMTVSGGPSIDNQGGTPISLYNPNGGSIPSAYTPEQNPNLQTSLAKQLASAKAYRANIPSMSDKLYGDYATQARQSLASNLKGVDKDFNRRGLLHSGMRTGAQIGTQAANTNDLANARSTINQGLLDTADQMDSNVYNSASAVAGTGYSMTNPLVQGAQTDIDAINAQNAANQAIWASLGRSAGSVAGGYNFQNGSATPSSNGTSSSSYSANNYGATY